MGGQNTVGHSYANLLCHIVFSTKERRPFLTEDMMRRLVPYVGGVARKRSAKLLAMNGPADHVHVLAITSPKFGVSELIRDVKADSSGWVHRTYPNLRTFAWQTGYGAFAVSMSAKDQVVEYIDQQQEHHRKMTFEEEFTQLLNRHGIEFDPRYVFG